MMKKMKKKTRLTRGRRASKKPFVEPEIVEQEPLRRVIQQSPCDISPVVTCFS